MKEAKNFKKNFAGAAAAGLFGVVGYVIGKVISNTSSDMGDNDDYEVTSLDDEQKGDEENVEVIDASDVISSEENND